MKTITIGLMIGVAVAALLLVATPSAADDCPSSSRVDIPECVDSTLGFKYLHEGLGASYEATNWCWLPVKIKLDFRANTDKTYWLDGQADILDVDQSVGPNTYVMRTIRSAKCCNDTEGSYCDQTYESTREAKYPPVWDPLPNTITQTKKQKLVDTCSSSWNASKASSSCELQNAMTINEAGTHCRITGAIDCDAMLEDGTWTKAHNWAVGTYLPEELREAQNCDGEFKIGDC